ncbi:MAG: UDP-N-acetylmuramoyl-L-alanine--D-glutamate ligase, partial [Deltaproteobacteria bacterium]|nr:UDP-N-acetylmuramoyl-L-alanine--D-glutamate ligase [Deltaproteobacteria bacterium]
MDLAGKKIFILGAARSGIAAALLAKREGAFVFVSDRKKDEEIKKSVELLKENNIAFETGRNSLERIKDFDILILSPGVSLEEKTRIELKSQNVKILSEIEFAFRFIRVPVIAITGTNGKSTTTSLIGHILNNAGVKAFVGGNIGNALSNLVLENRDYEVAVAEVSSFMLEDIEEFRPYITIFTNLSPDHLDRYKNYQEYIEAKLNIFRNLDSHSYVILNLDSADLVKATEKYDVSRIFFSVHNRDAAVIARKEGSGYRLESRIREKFCSVHYENPNLVGLHNLENALASFCASVLYGVKQGHIEDGINSFRGLPHRIEFVKEINGVRFYNDSKATNIDSSVVALRSFESGIVWIAGGRHKGTPYTGLAELVKTRVRKIIAIGEAAPLITHDLSPFTDVID